MTKRGTRSAGENNNAFHQGASDELINFYTRNGIKNISDLVVFNKKDVRAEKKLSDEDKGDLILLIERAKRMKKLKIEEDKVEAEKNKTEAEKFAKKALAEDAETRKINAKRMREGNTAPGCDFCGKRSCRGHPYSNWDADSNFLTRVVVREVGFVVVPYLKEAGLSELQQFRIFIRHEAFRLFKELEKRTNIEIQGSPGVGKSITVWLWALIQARRHKKTVRWIHLGKKKCNFIMDFDASGYKQTCCKKLKDSLIEECKTNILVVDGISKDLAHADVRTLCTLLVEDEPSCHMIMVHSEQSQTGDEDDNFLKFYMAGWRLSEYEAACKDGTLWESIKDKCFGPLVKQILYDPKYPSKDAFIANKYFYAGSCARFFFYRTIAKIKESVRKAFDRISDKPGLNSGSIGIKSLAAVNTIMAVQGGRYTFVSDYAFILCSQDYSEYVRGLESSLVASIGNRACYGIYYEHIFLRCLGDKEMKSPLNRIKGGVKWKFDLPIVFLDTFIAAMRFSDVSIYLSWVYDECKNCPAKVANSNRIAEKTRCSGRVDHEYKTLTDLRKHMTDHHGWNFAENAKNGWGRNKSPNYFKPEEHKISQARNEYLSMFESPGSLQPLDGELEIGQWLISSKFNNEGFDCIFRENESTLVLVQITISKSHRMKMGAFVRIAEYVKMKYPEITKAKIAYIVPSTASNSAGLEEASNEYKIDLGKIGICVEGTKSIYRFHPVEAVRLLRST